MEARDRLGGRIHNHYTLDLGPTWFWPGQRRMTSLAKELGIGVFEQQNQGDLLYEDPNVRSERIPGQAHQMTSYRVEGGISQFTQGLAARISPDKILLDRQVNAISSIDENLQVSFTQGNSEKSISTKRAFLALPPRLVGRTFSFEPALATDAMKDMVSIPTWMAGQAKALVTFDHPFWRDQNLSGQAFSRLGPLMEIHDASAPSAAPYVLFGFIGGTGKQRREIGTEKLRLSIEQQIKRLYGADSPSPTEIIIKDWAQNNLTATEDDMEPLQNHPSYGLPASLVNLWDRKLTFIGTEVAKSEGGYLEGALIAAEDALNQLA